MRRGRPSASPSRRLVDLDPLRARRGRRDPQGWRAARLARRALEDATDRVVLGLATLAEMVRFLRGERPLDALERSRIRICEPGTKPQQDAARERLVEMLRDGLLDATTDSRGPAMERIVPEAVGEFARRAGMQPLAVADVHVNVEANSLHVVLDSQTDPDRDAACAAQVRHVIGRVLRGRPPRVAITSRRRAR
jgi:hypothetical protein